MAVLQGEAREVRGGHAVQRLEGPDLRINKEWFLTVLSH